MGNRTFDYRTAFQHRVHALLSAHPQLRHEWRGIRDLSGERMDLIFPPPSPNVPEVSATLRNWQLTIGEDGLDTDFESWGRKMTEDDVAAEAMEHLVSLLCKHGYLPEDAAP